MINYTVLSLDLCKYLTSFSLWKNYMDTMRASRYKSYYDACFYSTIILFHRMTFDSILLSSITRSLYSSVLLQHYVDPIVNNFYV